jgi:hypothetical protein
MWSERVAAIGNPELPTHQAGWALTARYAQHVSSLLQEVTATGNHLRLRLEECADQVKANKCVVKDIQKGNRELLQKNARLEMRIRELNDELMMTYRNRDFKTDGTPIFKAKTRCSSYVCPGSSCHTYGQNVSTEYQCLYYIISYYKNLLQVQKGLNNGMDPILPQGVDRGFRTPRRNIHQRTPHLLSSRT